jgi:hypothetical protein
VKLNGAAAQLQVGRRFIALACWSADGHLLVNLLVRLLVSDRGVRAGCRHSTRLGSLRFREKPRRSKRFIEPEARMVIDLPTAAKRGRRSCRRVWRSDAAQWFMGKYRTVKHSRRTGSS